MTLNERIDSFAQLGELFRNFPGETNDPHMEKIRVAAKQAQIEKIESNYQKALKVLKA